MCMAQGNLRDRCSASWGWEAWCQWSRVGWGGGVERVLQVWGTEPTPPRGKGDTGRAGAGEPHAVGWLYQPRGRGFLRDG